MESKTISIKMVRFKIGWRRQVVNRRGKKMVYGVWRKPPNLNAMYTLESVQDLEPQHGLELEDELSRTFYGSITN